MLQAGLTQEQYQEPSVRKGEGTEIWCIVILFPVNKLTGAWRRAGVRQSWGIRCTPACGPALVWANGRGHSHKEGWWRGPPLFQLSRLDTHPCTAHHSWQIEVHPTGEQIPHPEMTLCWRDPCQHPHQQSHNKPLRVLCWEGVSRGPPEQQVSVLKTDYDEWDSLRFSELMFQTVCRLGMILHSLCLVHVF